MHTHTHTHARTHVQTQTLRNTPSQPITSRGATTDDLASSQSAEHTPAKRMRISEGTNSTEQEAQRLLNMLGQLCKASGQRPVDETRAGVRVLALTHSHNRLSPASCYASVKKKR